MGKSGAGGTDQECGEATAVLLCGGALKCLVVLKVANALCCGVSVSDKGVEVIVLVVTKFQLSVRSFSVSVRSFSVSVRSFSVRRNRTQYAY